MSDSNEYDLGYYEGWRNAIIMLVGHRMGGIEWHDILQAMRAERDKAHEEYQESIEGEWEEDQ